MDTTLAPTQAADVPAVELEFTVTDAAARRIGQILSPEPPGTFLRLSVEGGGCSGFSYKYDVTREQTEDDLVIEKEGAKIVVDRLSLDYIKGSQLDYKADLMGSAFKISNPLATAKCGCGSSFAV
ncbi:iron-sulfur cluster assembly accessory protein [Xanthobacter dioxanivorans]|uniref:Iron-sulfur cluster assembly accessory protein n=1 Tax=Xanthobacter dioxanivorans TaxID=2528964 RepID=A0A974PLB1_9HYPH|nr:iron-sulfur cluster assembly accessory protein [Xanthobacter dioxanivorans]QRG05299.1 iron-sulfur cluster assembly accessory protein [Xanthobacter dioxanivorans]